MAKKKINVKQVWDIELPRDMTLKQLKEMAETIQKDGDECYLKYNGTCFIARRVAG